MRRALLGVVGCVLALAGCGATKHHPSPQTLAPVVSGHACNASDYAMQCALQSLAPGATRQAAPAPGSSAPQTLYGIDFAWSCPSPSGRAFGASYLSYDFSKNWSRACVDAYHAAGAGTVAVWETSATRAAAGYSAGASDAREASIQLANLGAPPGQPFTMAIDFDASGPDVASYFQGANAAEPGRINAYGGAAPLDYLCSHGLVGHLNWATYAWLYRTGGQWPSADCAPLEQYQNSSSVDYDRALLPNYGQWPAPTPPPPAYPPPHYEFYARSVTTKDYGVLNEQSYVQRYDRLRSQVMSVSPTAGGVHGELRWLERRIRELADAAWTVGHPAGTSGWQDPAEARHRHFRFSGDVARWEGRQVAA